VFIYEIRHEEIKDREGTAKLQGFLNARSDPLHSPTTQFLREERKGKASIKYDTCWTPNPVWILDDRNISSPGGNQNPIPLSCSP